MIGLASMKFPISWSHPVAEGVLSHAESSRQRRRREGLPTSTLRIGTWNCAGLSWTTTRHLQDMEMDINCVPATSSKFGDVPDLSVEWAINIATDKREWTTVRKMEIGPPDRACGSGSSGILIKNEHYVCIPLSTLLASKKFFPGPPPPPHAALKSTIAPPFRAKWKYDQRTQG